MASAWKIRYVAEDHVLQALLVILVRHVESDIFRGPQLVGVLLVGLELFGAESARVGAGRMYFISFLLGQIHHGERGVQPAAECDYNFLFFHIV